MFSKQRPSAWLGILLPFALIGAACGDDGGASSGGNGVSGGVEVSGSSTVEPISVRVAELLADENPDISVNVDGPGTGDGFALFCEGQIDISDASRPIEDEEAAICEENGIEFTELLVAQDGITVLVNPANPLECLNFADLYALLSVEADGVDDWSDASDLAGELGSDTDLPDLSLEITAPGAESGTFGSFIEIVLEGIAEDRGIEDEPFIRNYAGQSDDNIIIQGIDGADGALGYVGFAFAENAGDRVKELAVAAEPGGECVTPTAETIADNSYPISRPLFIYVNDASIAEKPQVVEYVDYYLGDGYPAVEEVGYVFLDDAAKAETDATWEAAKG